MQRAWLTLSSDWWSNQSVKNLESVDLKSYTEKHARIKENYNSLVSSYNTSQAELKSVVMDISKRLNDVESKM